MNEEQTAPLSIEDVNLPQSLRRSIWLIKDMEDDNNYTADEILDNKPQDIIFNMRSSLTAAYKSGDFKYICPFCNQPLGIKVRTDEGGFFPFFSHFRDSSDYCPIKTTLEILDPSRIVINTEHKFKSSSLHYDMVEKLKEVLNLSQSFKNIEQDKVISTPEVSGYRRVSLYSFFKEDKKICFDALVNSPQIGLLVSRNAFYKMQKMFYLWVFPSFSTRHQRMSEKDILYMNRRNVFVFDSADYYQNYANKKYLDVDKIDANYKFAYEESIIQKRLLLNCYWQVPDVDDKGNVVIKWKGPELVAFEDLVFNTDSYEIYFHDSDQDFYHTYSQEKQMIIDEWMRIKADRWRKIYDSIEERRKLYEQTLAKRARKERLNYYGSLIESGEIMPEKFQDNKTKLWGYSVNGDEIISAAYCNVKPFYMGYAWVKKLRYWGIIDYKEKRFLSFRYNDIIPLSEQLCAAKQTIRYELIDYCGNILGEFDEIHPFKEGKAKARKNRKWGFINEKGEAIIPFEYDSVSDFSKGVAYVLQNGIKSKINGIGKEAYYYKKQPNGMTIYGSNFKNKVGLMDKNRKRITGLIYDEIKSFVADIIIAKKDGKWGCINEKGKVMIQFIYDKIYHYDGKIKFFKTTGYGRFKEPKLVKEVDVDNLSKQIDRQIDIAKIKADRLYTAKITGFHEIGMFIKVTGIGDSLVPIKYIRKMGKTMLDFQKGNSIIVQLAHINEEKNQATFKIVRE